MPALIEQYGLLVVALIIYFGEIGFPTLIPGEIALLLAGSQVIHSLPMLVAAAAVFAAVDIMGTSSIHLASRTGGNRLLLRLLCHLRRDKHEEVVEQWRSRLGGRDSLVVFVTRLIPMFRLYASITTGLIRIRFRDFVFGAVPAAVIWASTPLTLGYVLRSHIDGLMSQYGTMMHLIIASSIALTVLAAVAVWIRRASSKAAALRRGRLVLGLAAAFGACARLVTLPPFADHVTSTYGALPPSLPIVSSLISVIALVAMGLLWIAAHDLRVIRTRSHRSHNIGVASAAAWMGLMATLAAAALLV